MYKAILFDFDYTLADATEGIVASYNQAFREIGFDIQTIETIRNTVGMPAIEAFIKMTDCNDPKIIKEFKDHFDIIADQMMAENTVLYNMTSELLTKLHANGKKIGIVSTKYSNRIIKVFEKAGLYDNISVVIGGEHITKHKPDPEGILKALDILGINKNEVLYVGDHKFDAIAANCAGIDFAAIVTGTTTRQELSGYPFIRIFSNLEEFYQWIFNN